MNLPKYLNWLSKFRLAKILRNPPNPPLDKGDEGGISGTASKEKFLQILVTV
jgi:hypothetical protein